MLVRFAVFVVALFFFQGAISEGDGGKPAITSPPNERPRTCTSILDVCPSCDYMAVCVNEGDGNFRTLLQKCREDEKCVRGACVKGAMCNQGQFKCHQQGTYPDLYDCQKYHVCLPQPSSPDDFDLQTLTCNGTAYDAHTRSCGHPLDSEVCKMGPVPECIGRTQLGLIRNARSFYYFCVEQEDSTLLPELHLCPHTYHFNTTTKTCEYKDPCIGCHKKHY